MDVIGLLRDGELTVDARLVAASNVTLLGEVTQADERLRCVYKPVAGERPLWDFPDGSLAGREVAAYELSEAAGWHVVPPTVLRRDGPFGPGMCQAWIDQTGADELVRVVDPAAVPGGWLPIMDALDAGGAPVVVVHADDPGLRRLALFDAVINNADRKGGHVLRGDSQLGESMAATVGVDHGVSFHTDHKLRTVLWGWAGEQLTPVEFVELSRLTVALAGPLGGRLNSLLTDAELQATVERVDVLRADGAMPSPRGRMPVPWPVF